MNDLLDGNQFNAAQNMLLSTCSFGDHKCFAVEMERNEMLLMKMPFDPFGCRSTSPMINSNS